MLFIQNFISLFELRQREWDCNGTQSNPHPKVTNKTRKCQVCNKTYDEVELNLKKRRLKVIFYFLTVSSIVIGTVAAALAYTRSIENKFAHAKNQIDSLQFQIGKTEEYLKAEKTQHNGTKEKLTSTEQKVKQINNDLTKKVDELNNTKNELAQKQADLAQIQGQLERVQNQLSATNNQLQSTNKNLNHKIQELHSARQEVGKLKTKIPRPSQQKKQGNGYLW